MIFRLSQKVAAKIKEPDLKTVPPAVDPFSDWHVGMFIHERLQYLIVVNSTSLFTVLLRGKGIMDFEQLYVSFRAIMPVVLKEMGAPHLYDRPDIEAPRSRTSGNALAVPVQHRGSRYNCSPCDGPADHRFHERPGQSGEVRS